MNMTQATLTGLVTGLFLETGIILMQLRNATEIVSNFLEQASVQNKNGETSHRFGSLDTLEWNKMAESIGSDWGSAARGSWRPKLFHDSLMFFCKKTSRVVFSAVI